MAPRMRALERLQAKEKPRVRVKCSRVAGGVPNGAQDAHAERLQGKRPV